MKYLYYVSSPFQLMSALDVLKCRGGSCVEDSLIIVLLGNEKRAANYKQFLTLIEEVKEMALVAVVKFSNVVELEFKLIFTYLKVIFQFRELNEVIVGDFRDLFSHLLIRKVNAKKYSLLDDGAATLNIKRNFLDKGLHFPVTRGLYNKIRLFTYFILGMRPEKKILFTLYSIFDGKKIKKTQRDRCRRVLFIGSKYSESKIVSLNEEVSLIKYISTLYDTQMTYIPHRDDSSHKLELIQAEGICISKLDIPIERYFSTFSDVSDTAIAGFWTTALYTLGKYHSFAAVDSYDISEFVNSDHIKIGAKNVYYYYNEVGINVVDLSRVWQ